MIYYALVFLVVALISGVLGFSGIAGPAANIAWILFVVGMVLAVVFFVRGREYEGYGYGYECPSCKAARKARARIRTCGSCSKEF